MIYDNFRNVCKRKGTNLTAVLKSIGCSSGSTGRWKNGGSPTIDIVIKIANYLDVSLDELVYDRDDPIKKHLGISDEWVSIIRSIPDEKHEMCKDFLRTHAYVPEKYADKKKA